LDFLKMTRAKCFMIVKLTSLTSKGFLHPLKKLREKNYLPTWEK